MTVEELYASIGGDYAAAKKVLMMDKMIARFVGKLPDDPSFERLMTAGETMDAAGIFNGAHAMKGVCANLGLTTLSAAAGELCEEFRGGRAGRLSDAEVTERLQAIRELYERTVAGIRAFQAQQ